ncbi:MAG: MFS transporter [Myxococcales bacterium]|nr:MFS transporter [Myxococcota bacterium]MDW8283551.1 MFS transporter [Myxococcales bacterium]
MRPGPNDDASAQQRQRLAQLQARVFGITWLSYASYYLTRKNLSVVKSRLHDELGVSAAALGVIDTLYLVGYAAGQFVSGVLGDRFGPRRLIAAGMMASAATALIFGASRSVLVFALCFGLNGLFQSTGWPNNVKAMQPWFGRHSRGRIMGLWCTNYQVGGLVATALATYLLTRYGWQASFWAPGMMVAGVGALVLLGLVERPEDCGLSPLHEEMDGASRPSQAAASAAPTLGELLRMPALWALGGAYFGLKLIRYSLLFWLPFYLHQQLGYPESTAGYMATAFEAGGIAGAVTIGWLSDRYVPHRRARLAAPCILALGAALLLYQRVSGTGLLANGLAIGLVGFLLFGPDTLISGAAAQDLGGHRATAGVAGVINGMGSVGAVLQGMVTAGISQRWGWDALLHCFVVMALLSGLALVGLALRQQPRRAHT